MLVITRKAGQTINVGPDIIVTITEVRKGGRVRVGITAPRQVEVTRPDMKKVKEPKS